MANTVAAANFDDWKTQNQSFEQMASFKSASKMDLTLGDDTERVTGVAVAAIVANEQGELPLTQRSDSGVWLYPVGYADVGYSPCEVAIKEVYEETGIECEPVSLIAVLDGLPQALKDRLLIAHTSQPSFAGL